LPGEGPEQGDQKQAQKFSQPCEDEAEVVSDGGEDGVCGIAIAALEVAAAEMPVGLHVADHGFDGGAPSQLALDGAEHAALLTGDEDAARICRIVPESLPAWEAPPDVTLPPQALEQINLVGTPVDLIPDWLLT
jgi:hypothetical protein